VAVTVEGTTTYLGKEHSMNRGNQQINLVYENLVSSQAPLAETVQRRIYAHAKSTKDVNLAAGLAKRTDTVREIDDALSKWGAAKIQAAWYMRHGRDKDVVRNKILKEDRVTILEVVAGIGGLDESVYEACAEHCVPRVALALLMNDGASEESRTKAARSLAAEYGNLSYEKRNTLSVALGSASEEIAGAFICAMSDLRVISHLLGNIKTLSPTAEGHVLTLVDGLFTKAGKLYDRQVKSGSKSNRWDEDGYPMMISVVNSVLAGLAKYPVRETPERERLLTKHVEFIKKLDAGRNGPHDQETYSDVAGSIQYLGGTDTYESSALLRVRAAKSPKELMTLIDSYDTKGELDSGILTAALQNTNLNLEVALRVAKEIRWCGVDVEALLRAKKDTYPVYVLGALMTATWEDTDELIENLMGTYSSKELWSALVSASIANDGNSARIDRRVLESKYADAEVLPSLPFSLFTTGNLPEWLLKSFGEYLEANLPDERAWDGFETLAKSHLGTVEQLVKAARLTTRKR